MHSERRTSLPGPRAIALTVVSLSLLAAACGGSESPSQSAQQSTAPPAASAPAGGGPRVSFTQPKDGATVKSPVHFEFGSDNITIAAVPEKVEKPREGMGHHHLGVDTDCLPGGQVIPPGTPAWVHFGKGNNTIDMQLSPGPHKFALQIGDDEHRTMPGVCEVINITVAP
jgi:hypothetical protein